MSYLEPDNVTANILTVTQLKIPALNAAPASATAAGTKGDIVVAADFIYVCSATNTWVRSALTTWS